MPPTYKEWEAGECLRQVQIVPLTLFSTEHPFVYSTPPARKPRTLVVRVAPRRQRIQRHHAGRRPEGRWAGSGGVGGPQDAGGAYGASSLPATRVVIEVTPAGR